MRELRMTKHIFTATKLKYQTHRQDEKERKAYFSHGPDSSTANLFEDLWVNGPLPWRHVTLATRWSLSYPDTLIPLLSLYYSQEVVWKGGCWEWIREERIEPSSAR